MVAECLIFLNCQRNACRSFTIAAAGWEFGNTAVVTGAIDQIAGAIGAGIIKKGVISEMTGTTMVIFVPSDSIPAYNPASKVPCHYNFDGKYCLMLWTTTAGMALKWFKNNFARILTLMSLTSLPKMFR